MADWRVIFDSNRDLDEFCSELRVLRREQDLAATRWTGQAIRRAIVLALAAGYEPQIVPAALRAMAIDPATELPGRLAHAGPWWDVAETHDLTRRRDAKAAAALDRDRSLAAARAACDCEFGWRSVVVDGHETTRRCTTCRPTAADAPTRRSHSA